MHQIRRPHRAWAVCLGGGMALFSTMGLGVNVFSVYQPFLLEGNGFTNAQGSWITTTRSLFILAALLTVSQLCARMGLRRVMTLGTALVGVSCLCFSGARSFPACCAAAALTGIGYCYGGMVPLSLVIGRWFRDRRGLALGLASAGSGVSTVLAPGLITAAIRRWGMGRAFLLEGLVLLAAAALVGLLVRDDPASLGLRPYETGESGSGAARRRQPEGPGLGKGAMAVLLAAALLAGGPGGPGFSHLTVLYTSSGYPEETAAALVAWMGLIIALSKVLGGQIYDRLGGYRGNFCIYGMFLAGFVLSTLAPLGSRVLPFVAVTVFGLGMPVTVLTFPQWATDLCGAESERAVRTITVAYTAGMLVFGPLPGALADRLGSYVPAYWLFALFLVVSLALVQGVYRKEGVS